MLTPMPLLIFAIAASLRLLKRSPMWVMANSQSIPKKSRTINHSLSGKIILSNNARVTCKQCKKSFKRITWLENRVCENPNCSCPEVKRSMKAANEAISKAQTSSKSTDIKKYETPLPDDYDTLLGENQYYVDCPPVQVINI